MVGDKGRKACVTATDDYNDEEKKQRLETRTRLAMGGEKRIR